MVFLPKKGKKGRRVSLSAPPFSSRLSLLPSISRHRRPTFHFPPRSVSRRRYYRYCIPSRRGGRPCTNFQRFWQRNLAATKLDFDLTYYLSSFASFPFFLCLRSPFFSRSLVPVSTDLSFCSLLNRSISRSLLFPFHSFLPCFLFFAAFAEFLILYASPFLSIPITSAFSPFFFSLRRIRRISPLLHFSLLFQLPLLSLFLRRFLSFKFFIISSFFLSFYPLSSRSSSFPFFFLPLLSPSLSISTPNPLRYAATTYFSFSRWFLPSTRPQIYLPVFQLMRLIRRRDAIARERTSQIWISVCYPFPLPASLDKKMSGESVVEQRAADHPISRFEKEFFDRRKMNESSEEEEVRTTDAREEKHDSKPWSIRVNRHIYPLGIRNIIEIIEKNHARYFFLTANPCPARLLTAFDHCDAIMKVRASLSLHLSPVELSTKSV